MGHRSDVAYVIAGEKDDVLAFLTLCRLNHPEVKLALEECTVGKFGEESLFIGFEASGVKWYPDYPDVKTHLDLWELAESYGAEWKETGEGNGHMISPLCGQYCELDEDDEKADKSFGDDGYDLWDHVRIRCELTVSLDFSKEHDIRDSMKEEVIKITEADAKLLLDTIDNPPAPNEALTKAFAKHR